MKRITIESFYTELSRAGEHWGKQETDELEDGSDCLPVRVLGFSAEHAGALQLLPASCFGLVKPTWGMTLDGTLQSGYRPLPAKAREIIDRSQQRTKANGASKSSNSEGLGAALRP
jgi:hypothetical protein|eukprot:COSAG01_NODE_7539_length_3159_cov_2.557190_3_plen_116_part_00